MKNMVERLLYVTLLVVFIGMGVGIYLLTTVLHKQDEALKSQSQILTALNRSVDTLKKDNAYRTAIVICMLQVPVAQRTTDLRSNCEKSVTPVIPSKNPSSSASKSASSQPTRSTPAQSTPTRSVQSAPTSQPDKPSVIDRVTKTVDNVLRRVGL